MVVENEVQTLPNGWESVKLEKVVLSAQAGFASGIRDPSGIVQLRMNNVSTRGSFDWSHITRVPRENVRLEVQGLQANDVLFNNTNSVELVGKSILFPGYSEPVVYSNHFTRVRVRPELLESNYLAFWLQMLWPQGVFERLCDRWVGQAAVQRDKLLQLEIPLPPLETQRRIAATLEAQLNAVAKARAAAEAQLETARGMTGAFMRSVFEHMESQGIPRTPFGTALMDIQAGKSLQCEERPARANEWGVLRVSAVSWGVFDPDQNKVLPVGYESPEQHEVKEGDLIISRANTTELVGAVARVPKIRAQLALSDKTLRLTPDERVLVKDYLEFALREKIARNYIEENATGTSSSMKNISQEVIRQIPILIPPLEVQAQVVSKLKSELEGAARLVQSLESQLETINAMPAALLRDAFSGKL